MKNPKDIIFEMQKRIDIANLIIKGVIDSSSVNNEKRIFSGWGSAEIVDRQGDYLPISEFKPVMDILMERGAPITDGHSNHQVGRIIDYQYKAKPTGEMGLYLTGEIFRHYPSDDQVWQDIVEGKYTGFSLGGKAGNKVPKCTNMGCYNLLSNIEAWEFSIVDRPANQLALIDNFNKLAKGNESVGTTNAGSAENPKKLKVKNVYIISDSDTHKIDKTIENILKERKYVEDIKEVPSGAQPHKGKYGGIYYETKPKAVGHQQQNTEIDPYQTITNAWSSIERTPRAMQMYKVLDEMMSGNTSKKENFDPKIGYTPARQELHQRIVDEFVGKDTAAGTNGPIALFIGGIPASGKTTLLNILKIPVYRFVMINLDDIKARLPGYNGINAMLYHDETCDIVFMILQKSISERRNILIDGTMKNLQKETIKIQHLKRLGYRIKIISVTTSPDTAIIRAKERFLDTGRYIPLTWIAKEGQKINDIQPKYKDLSEDYQLWDSSTYPPRRVL